MKNLLFAPLALGLAIAQSQAEVLPPNLILNGSFELGNFQENTIYPGRMELPNGSTFIDNWTLGTAGHFWWLQAPNYNAQQGNRSVDLDSNQVLPFTYIEQTFATTIGQAYEISAYYASEGNGGPAQVSLFINGGFIGAVATGLGPGDPGPDFPNLVWSPASFVFVASASSTTLRFQDSTTETFNNPIIDNVSVVAVPEPSAWGLIGGALVGFSLWRVPQ